MAIFSWKVIDFTFTRERRQRSTIQLTFLSRRCFSKGTTIKLAGNMNTLFVGNLPPDMGDTEVQEALRGIVGPGFTDFDLKKTPPPASASRGFCFISFPTREGAEDARRLLQSSAIRGRVPNVMWTTRRPDEGFGFAGDGGGEANSKTVFVQGISMATTEDGLRAAVSRFGGDVVSCWVARHRVTGAPRGFAFVEYSTRDQALAVIAAVGAEGGIVLDGCRATASVAKPPPPPGFRRFMGRGAYGRARFMPHRGRLPPASDYGWLDPMPLSPEATAIYNQYIYQYSAAVAAGGMPGGFPGGYPLAEAPPPPPPAMTMPMPMPMPLPPQEDQPPGQPSTRYAGQRFTPY